MTITITVKRLQQYVFFYTKGTNLCIYVVAVRVRERHTCCYLCAYIITCFRTANIIWNTVSNYSSHGWLSGRRLESYIHSAAAAPLPLPQQNTVLSYTAGALSMLRKTHTLQTFTRVHGDWPLRLHRFH